MGLHQRAKEVFGEPGSRIWLVLAVAFSLLFVGDAWIKQEGLGTTMVYFFLLIIWILACGGINALRKALSSKTPFIDRNVEIIARSLIQGIAFASI